MTAHAAGYWPQGGGSVSLQPSVTSITSGSPHAVLLNNDAGTLLANNSGFVCNQAGTGTSSLLWVGIGSSVGTAGSSLDERLRVRGGLAGADVIRIDSGGSNCRLRAIGSGGTNGVWFGQAATALQVNNADGGTLDFMQTGTTRWTINASGHLMAGADNTYDIGASGATRPKDLYLGGGITAGAASTFNGNVTVASTNSLRIGANFHTIAASASAVLSINAASGTDQRITVNGRMAAGSTANADVTINSLVTRTAGKILSVTNNGTEKVAWNFDGKEVHIAGNTQTTVGAAGGASALPATPTGYLRFFVGATEYVIPYYAQA